VILIILPVKNESENIEKNLNHLLKWCGKNLKDTFEILVIDDWSSDATLDQVVRMGKEKIRAFSNRFDCGKGSALKTGYIFSSLVYSLYDNDSIVFMDGDGQIDPAGISTMFKIMDLYSADVVIGNKRHTFSNTDYPIMRRIVSKGYNWMIRVLFGIKYQDTQCGIKIFKKGALDWVIDKVNVKRYAFDLELIVALRENKFRVADAPVRVKKQTNSGSVHFRSILRTFIDTLIVWVKKKKGFYR